MRIGFVQIENRIDHRLRIACIGSRDAPSPCTARTERPMDERRDPAIHVFYRPEQVLAVDSPENFSKSPQKPRLLLEFLSRHGLDRHFVRHRGTRSSLKS